MTLLRKLKRPYYAEPSILKRLRTAFLFGLFVFLFLYLFQPFSLNTVPSLLMISVGYGLCCCLVMAFLNCLLPALLPRFFSEEKWNIGKEILWTLCNIALIGLVNALYSVYLGLVVFHPRTVLLFESYTILLGLFPVTATVMLNEARLKKKFEKSSEQINRSLETLTESDSGHITLISENRNEDLLLKKSDFLFARAADNYSELHFLSDGTVQKKLIRSSLKNIEQTIGSDPELLRCHKSYIVNLKRVTHVSGNAQGFKLHLGHGDQPVPVSRSLNEAFRERLAEVQKLSSRDLL